MAASPLTLPAAADGFLATAGWAGAAVRPLAVDASFRRYFRIEGAPGRAVLMDAPPAHEDSRPFLHMAEWLHRHGFHPPAVLAQDLDQGLLLLEDLGDARMAEAIATGAEPELAVYRRAVELLRALHALPPAPLPGYDLAILAREAALFTEWYLPAVGLAVPPDAQDELAALWSDALGDVAAAASVTVLRDFHAENIMLLPDGALGLLDFQDALAGHPAYDLVSLLQDARREVSPAVEAAMLAHYGLVDTAAYALLGAQRNAKILGIFSRLWRRDSKPRYLTLQPRVWRYLERDLMHPTLAPVRGWFDRHVPPGARAAAWTE